jgi:DNA-binding NarL/FixJ family response regulator
VRREVAGCPDLLPQLRYRNHFASWPMRDDPNLAAAALELGPIRFVLKHATGTELLKAIDKCTAWEALFDC